MKSIQDGGVHHHSSFRLPDELAIGDIIILALITVDEKLD
jgi:hypothetical protein